MRCAMQYHVRLHLHLGAHPPTNMNNRIVRYEFMGSPLIFTLLCLTGLLIPFAVIYLVNGTLRIEHEMNDPEAFVVKFRSRKLWGIF